MTRIDGGDVGRAPIATPSCARVLAHGTVPAVPLRPSTTGAAIAQPANVKPLQTAGGVGPARVNCFTPGTMIATPRGAAAIEALCAGDMVITRDNGPQEIRWIGQKRLAGPPLRLDTRLQPVRIRAGALGPGLPERDLHVSPNHRVLLLGDHPALDGAEAEVFVSARHLVGTRGIERASVPEVTYLHFMCDRHEVVLSNGAWTESFQPSDDALEGVSERAREELLDLFPDLATGAARDSFGAARPTFGAHRVRKLRA